MVGLLAFFMFRRTATQTRNAVSSNQALFAYRQVKPVDPVLVRAGLEGFLMVVIMVILSAEPPYSTLVLCLPIRWPYWKRLRLVAVWSGFRADGLSGQRAGA